MSKWTILLEILRDIYFSRQFFGGFANYNIGGTMRAFYTNREGGIKFFVFNHDKISRCGRGWYYYFRNMIFVIQGVLFE